MARFCSALINAFIFQTLDWLLMKVLVMRQSRRRLAIRLSSYIQPSHSFLFCSCFDSHHTIQAYKIHVRANNTNCVWCTDLCRILFWTVWRVRMHWTKKNFENRFLQGRTYAEFYSVNLICVLFFCSAFLHWNTHTHILRRMFYIENCLTFKGQSRELAFSHYRKARAFTRDESTCILYWNAV